MPLPVRVYQQHSLLKQNFTAHIFADGTKHIWIRIKMLDLYSVVSLVPLSVIVSLEYLKFNQIFFMCQTRTVRPKWQKSSMLHLVSESNSRSLSNSGVSISYLSCGSSYCTPVTSSSINSPMWSSVTPISTLPFTNPSYCKLSSSFWTDFTCSKHLQLL